MFVKRIMPRRWTENKPKESFPHDSPLGWESHYHGAVLRVCWVRTSLLHSVGAKPDEARDGALFSLAQHLQTTAEHLIWRVVMDGQSDTQVFFSLSLSLSVPRHDVRATSSRMIQRFTVHDGMKPPCSQQQYRLTLDDAMQHVLYYISYGVKRNHHGKSFTPEPSSHFVLSL